MKRGLLILAPLLVSATQPAEQCSAPVAVPKTVTTPNATYYSDGEPPARFSHPPATPLKIVFGRDQIDALCGRPPCGKVFLGCQRGDMLALPDPFKDPEFAKITRHELAHVNGWPETHGD